MRKEILLALVLALAGCATTGVAPASKVAKANKEDQLVMPAWWDEPMEGLHGQAWAYQLDLQACMELSSWRAHVDMLRRSGKTSMGGGYHEVKRGVVRYKLGFACFSRLVPRQT